MTLPVLTDKIDIYSLFPEELKDLLAELGEPKFRAGQIFRWLHKTRVSSFDEMTDLSLSLRRKLDEICRFPQVEPVDVLVSGIDGTRKYVLSLFDGNVIEAVLMRYHHGNSVCVSSQVGCRMGCTFCASTLGGCERNLKASEILSEVYAIEKDTGERVSHVVIMGAGEPFDNYDEVLRFIRLITHKEGAGLSARNITLSTCGIVPGMERLAGESLPVTLALSLHAPDQQLREQMMPIARKYRLPEVLKACRDYFQRTGRRVTFEYSVVKGVNDSPEQAKKLAELIRDVHGHVNLIPVNPVEETGYRSPERKTVEEFQKVLTKAGINATIRREMGRDISSACGQLRRRYIEDAGMRSH